MNVKNVLEINEEIGNLLNVVLEDVFFMFKKVGEVEMVLVDDFKDLFKKICEVLVSNFDLKDLEWVLLYDELC